MTVPRVSVLMSVYNGEDTLSAAVESILGQTFDDLEFVIVEDGSSDASSEILSEYARKDTRVRVIRQENSGLTRALNRGLELCRAPLVARQDADDVSLPQRIEQQVQFMDENPGVVLLGTGAQMLGRSRTPYALSQYPTDDSTLRRIMQKTNPFFHTSVMFRREAVEKLGGYDIAFRRAQDYELWLRLLGVGESANLSEVLVEVDQGAERVSRKYARAQVTAALKAKWKNRHGSVLKGAPFYLFWWNVRGYIIPPGTLHAIRARWS